MHRTLTIFGMLLVAAGTTFGQAIRGEYLEARNADVWTGPCFANGEMNIIGNKATMAWKVTEGRHQGEVLDGLCVVAVVFGDNTFGLDKPVKTRAVILVDERGTASQQAALVSLAKDLAGETIQEVIAVSPRAIAMNTAYCDGKGCARLETKEVSILTRCLHEDDSICGHEEIYYPVLAKVDSSYAAYAKEHVFRGDQFGETFSHGNSRSVVLGGFALGHEPELARK